MVIGVFLEQVDSVEGPMPQTRFVLKKALQLGHSVVVVVNKVDRPSARPEYVVNTTFELFIELNATDEQVCATMTLLNIFSVSLYCRYVHISHELMGKIHL